MELHLDRELSNKRIFPALDFEKVELEKRSYSIIQTNLIRSTLFDDHLKEFPLLKLWKCLFSGLGKLKIILNS